MPRPAPDKPGRTLTDEDVEAIAKRVVSLLRDRYVYPGTEDGFLSSKTVMAMLHYRNSGTFWQFVWSRGVPFIRLNSRRFVFDRAQMEDWLSRHSTRPMQRFRH